MKCHLPVVGVVVGCITFLYINRLILMEVIKYQAEPYMDEIFHIAQAQRYCSGRYSEWDSMITTLPGLYWISVGLLEAVSLIFPIDETCPVLYLRAINVLLAAGNFVLLWKLLNVLHHVHDVKCRWWQVYMVLSALALAMFPVLYFFTFLYYTDAGSTFFILCSYLFSLQQRHCMSAAVGAVAVIFRQTNIVWIMFFALCIICDTLVNSAVPSKHAVISKSNSHALIARFVYSWLRRAVLGNNKHLLLKFISQTLLNIWPYCIVFLSFVTFVWINGGIVVGARHDHEVGLHFPQLFYCTVFTVCFAAAYMVSLQNIIAFIRFVRQHLLLSIFLLLLYCCAIWRFTYVHRYLLADNRHYTFYVWSRFFARYSLMRYAYAPLYLLSGYLILRTLALQRHFLWCIAYVVCVAALLVPATLLEFRYYIVPYLIFRLNIPVASFRRLIAEISIYASINMLTIYIFLHRPFHWNSEMALQRFMW